VKTLATAKEARKEISMMKDRFGLEAARNLFMQMGLRIK
jgi:hypothetical protein